MVFAMTLLDAACFANLFFAALLVGNEVGTWAVVHPALKTLPFEANVRPEQAIVRRYARFMPALMIPAIASGALVLALGSEGAAFALTLAGVACLTAMLAVTLLGNVPINRRILEASPDMPPPTWWWLRRRWDRLHSARVALDVAALSLLIAAVLV